MTTSDLPTLSADAIREAFLREAEADTQMVIRVAEQVASFEAGKAALESAHRDLTDVYRQAQSRPNVAAKLAELGIPTLDSLTVAIGNTRVSRGATSSRRGGKKRAARPAAPAAPAPSAAGSSASAE
ncbi:MAG: hypothetical protein AB7G47_20205 [Mycolicibacterium sp.]|uniref:hypothetical protein n=1 Tax=Mycolicibacterium sp. TaxID=2320850 RepID=UPI003D127DBE